MKGSCKKRNIQRKNRFDSTRKEKSIDLKKETGKNQVSSLKINGIHYIIKYGFSYKYHGSHRKKPLSSFFAHSTHTQNHIPTYHTAGMHVRIQGGD